MLSTKKLADKIAHVKIIVLSWIFWPIYCIMGAMIGAGINKITRTATLAKSAFWQYRWQIATLAALSFLGGVLEVVGINSIIPIFSVIQGGETPDIISRTTGAFFFRLGIPYTVKFLMIFMALMFLIKAVLLFLSRHINLKIAADYEENTRKELFQVMVESNWPYLARQKAGYLSQILITDTERGSDLLINLGGMALIITNFIAYGLLALNISFAITALAFVFGGAILLIFKPFFYKNRVASAEMAQKYKDLAHYAAETVSGMKVIKSSRAEDQVLSYAKEKFGRMKALYLRAGFLRNITEVTLQPITAFFILGILAVFYKTETLNFASFAVIIYAINRVFSNIQAAQTEIHVLNATAPYVMSILTFKDGAKLNKEKEGGAKPFKFSGSLEFKNVGFSYNGSSQTLSGINFSIRRGSMVGIVGPSGAGKSTLVDLLLRLYRPREGTVLADGENVDDISLREWRANIAYVPQEPFLINDTIANNIKFYDDALSETNIVEASKMANICDFIQSLPDGFGTAIGERGLRLSGGERQRIVLARALARRPQILILDEATSALDGESELAIQKAIEKLKGRMTIIAIAHRLSTVINSDKLIVLEGGRIREEGGPEELLRNKESYFYKTYHIRE